MGVGGGGRMMFDFDASVAFPQAENVEQSVIMRDGVTQWQLEQHNRRSCPTGH